MGRAEGAGRPAGPPKESEVADSLAGGGRFDEFLVKEGYRTAEALQKNGDLSAALSVLRMTYERVRTPFLLWPMAQLDLKLHLPLEGLRALDEYKSRVPPEERRGEGRDADKLRKDLQAQVARLKISADEPGAIITVDGKEQGAAPLSGDIEIDPGRHRVEAHGKHTTGRDVLVWPGRATPVHLLASGSEQGGRSGTASIVRWTLLGTGVAAMIVGGAIWADKSGCSPSCNAWGAGIGVFSAGAGLSAAALILTVVDRQGHRHAEAEPAQD